MQWFSAGIRASEPVTHGSYRITQQSLALSLMIPWPHGGLAWVYNRPISVRIEEDGVPPRNLPVINYTRLAMLGIFIYIAFISNIFRRVIHGRK